MAGLLGMATPGAPQEKWPITFTTVSVASSSFKGIDRNTPLFDCQPELFDPRTTRYRLVKRGGAPPEMYEVEGADESASMMIDGWNKQGEDKTALPKPYSVTKYEFGCASESSSVFEIKKNGVRHALYTHITQVRFSPDLKTLALFDYLRTPKGGWQEARRIIEIETKTHSSLPIIDATTFLADVTNERVVTYGLPIGSASEQNNPRRVVCIWGRDGKLIRALSAPIHDTLANGEESDDGIGLLPGEPTTFYHLTRTGENQCTLRLQDIERQGDHRSIRLAVPGSAAETAGMGTRLQVDLHALRLKGGTMRYRVSSKGRGDISGDWGHWRVLK